MARIGVIGGGPAGSTFAARMAQLGHDVSLAERAVFPRAHLGESLSPGVLPLLEATGAREAIENAGFRRVRHVHVQWDEGPKIREDVREEGLLVDRGRFDQLLLERALKLGVRRVASIDDADFTADARGRSNGSATRRRTSCRTIAVYAYWRGSSLPLEPRIEAGENCWYWGVPLPDGSYNTQVFIDENHFRDAQPAPLAERFLSLLGRSGLMTGCYNASMTTPARTMDSTPFLDDQCVTAAGIKVGDAALAIDPISSSGAQKAIQGALAAAVVANTILRRPEQSEAAMQFYRNRLMETSMQHSRWAAKYYSSVALQRPTKFWQDRASQATGMAMDHQTTAALSFATEMTRLVAISSQTEFVKLPCLDGDFVELKTAIRHPNLNDPVAFLGGRDAASLLQRVPTGMNTLQLARYWSDQPWPRQLPFQSALAIAGWLLQHGILVAE